jgi:hypothetical protein
VDAVHRIWTREGCFGASSLEAVVVSPSGAVSGSEVLARREPLPGGAARGDPRAIEAIPWGVDTAVDGAGRGIVAWSIPRIDQRQAIVRSEGVAASVYEPGRGWSGVEEITRLDGPALGLPLSIVTFGEARALVYWVVGGEDGSRLFVSGRR